MRTSADPLTKEIGSGLADGSLTWRTIGTSSAYSDYVQHNLDAMQTFDFGAVVDEMEQDKAEAAQVARQQDEDPDELWQGFNRGRQ
jgi:hypothetical protein